MLRAARNLDIAGLEEFLVSEELQTALQDSFLVVFHLPGTHETDFPPPDETWGEVALPLGNSYGDQAILVKE